MLVKRQTGEKKEVQRLQGRSNSFQSAVKRIFHLRVDGVFPFGF
jgi:hypothetical protein